MSSCVIFDSKNYCSGNKELIKLYVFIYYLPKNALQKRAYTVYLIRIYPAHTEAQNDSSSWKILEFSKVCYLHSIQSNEY